MTERSTPRCTQIIHVASGIAGFDWKPRGRGNSALMIGDSVATVRHWIKILSCAGASNKSSHWIEEIARFLNAELTKRASAFCWIGVVAMIVPEMRLMLVLWALLKLFRVMLRRNLAAVCFGLFPLLLAMPKLGV